MIKKRTYLTKTESKRVFFLLMTGIMTVGIIIGSCFSTSIGDFNSNAILNQYISPLYNGDTLLEIMENTIISVCCIILLIFCTGFFSVGQPLSILFLIYRGFGIGLSVASTYMTFGKKGLYITLIFIVPKVLSTSVIIMLSARESMKLSNIIYNYLFRATAKEDMGKYVRLYCIKFIVLIFFVFLTAVADSGLNYFFGYLL